MNVSETKKMYSYVRSYASSQNMIQTLIALSFARKACKHKRRENGELYISRILFMAYYALRIGIDNDCTIATILLHNICEDFNVELCNLQVNEEVQKSISIVCGSYKEFLDMKTQYMQLADNKDSFVAKILDICFNIPPRCDMKKRITELRDYMLPTVDKMIGKHICISNQLFIIKCNIINMCNVIELTMKGYSDTNV